MEKSELIIYGILIFGACLLILDYIETRKEINEIREDIYKINKRLNKR